MDHKEQHHQQHQKEREHKKHEQHLHEQAQESKSSLPVHPKWLFVVGFALIVVALLVWTFIIW